MQELDQKDHREALEQLFGSDDEPADVSYRELRMQLVRFFQKELVSFFWRRKLSGGGVVEDLADEVMMRVLRGLARGSVIKNAKGYAFGVARYVALEYKRKPQHLSLDADLVEEKEDENRLTIPIWDPPPQIEELERAQRASLLEECINQLRPKDQELLVKYYFEQQNREKLKAEFGMSDGQLRVKLFRIRKRLELSIRRKTDRARKEMGT